MEWLWCGMQVPQLSVILFTFNNPDSVRGCLATLKVSGGSTLEILLVDNNSFSRPMLRFLREAEADPRVRILHYPFGYRFPRIANYAAGEARGESILFLHSGLRGEEGWLGEMHAFAVERGAGIAGRRVVEGNGRTSSPSEIRFDGGPLGGGGPAAGRLPSSRRSEVGLSADCLWIRRDLFRQLGGFNTEYWNGWYDADLCRRALAAGAVVDVQNSLPLRRVEEGFFPGPRPVTRLHDRALFLRNRCGGGNEERERICLILPLTMGDVILGTGALKGVRQRYPQATIGFATDRRYAPVLKNNPSVNEVIELRDHPSLGQCDFLEYVDAETEKILSSGNWDRIIQLQIQDLPMGYWGTGHHLVDLYGNLAGLAPGDSIPEIFPGREERRRIDRLLAEHVRHGEKVLVLHPGSGWALKSWPKTKYARLVRRLRHGCACRIFTLGKEGETGPAGEGIISMIGRLSILESAELIRRAALFIGGDSAPMHMASALRVPVVALLGCTGPSTGGPVGTDFICVQSDYACSNPCHMWRCYTGEHCIRRIPVGLVERAARRLLERTCPVRETWWRGRCYAGATPGVFNGPGTGGFVFREPHRWKRGERTRQSLYYLLHGVGWVGRFLRCVAPEGILEFLRRRLHAEEKPVSTDRLEKEMLLR